jgi:glutaredoxin 3
MPPVDIYTKPYCPYCSDAKDLLRAKGVEFNEIVANRDPALRAEMIQRSNGGMTYPQIFIGEVHVGGCDELYALDQAGGLDPLLERQVAE